MITRCVELAVDNDFHSESGSEEAIAPVYLGDTLHLSIANAGSIATEVVWTSGDRCGVRFRNEVDGIALLVQIAEQHRRAALVETGQASRHHSGPGRCPDEIDVSVLLEGGRKHRGVFRWARGETACVRFLDNPMAPCPN